MTTPPTTSPRRLALAITLILAAIALVVFWPSGSSEEQRLQSAIVKKPNSAAAYEDLGNYYLKLGGGEGGGVNPARLDLAAREFQKAISLQPAPAFFNQWAQTFLLRQDFANAVDVYSQGLLQFPDNADLLINDGIALFALARTKEAIFVLTPGLEKSPDSLPGQRTLAQALRRDNRPTAALEHSEKYLALAQGPEEITALNDLALTLIAMERYPDAIDRLHRAQQLAPRDLATLNNLGRALHLANQLPDALKVYDDALALNPDDPETHFNRGSALAASGRFPEALAEFKKATQLKPTYADAWAAMAELLSQNTPIKDLPQAIADGEKACTLTNDEDPVALFVLESAYAKSNRWQDAINAAQRALIHTQTIGDDPQAKEIAGRIVEYRDVAKTLEQNAPKTQPAK